MSGAGWGGTENFAFTEEKHETGYCLELHCNKTAKTPIQRGPTGWVYEWEDNVQIIDHLTVPQVEQLASDLLAWAETMRTGGHFHDP